MNAYCYPGNRNRRANSAAHTRAPKGLRKWKNNVKKEKIPQTWISGQINWNVKLAASSHTGCFILILFSAMIFPFSSHCLLVHWPKCSCSGWSVYICSCSLIWVIVNSAILQRSVCSEFNHNYFVRENWSYHSLLYSESFSGFWRKSEAIGRSYRALRAALLLWPQKIWICLLVLLQLFVPLSFLCPYKQRKFR